MPKKRQNSKKDNSGRNRGKRKGTLLSFLLEKVPETLHENRPDKFIAKELAGEIFINFPDECRELTGSSTNKESKKILARNIRVYKDKKWRKHPNIDIQEGYRIFYSWIAKTSKSKKGVKGVRDEDELYPKLDKFLWEKRRVEGWFINHRIGSQKKKGVDEWRYPDMVAFEDLTEDWDDDLTRTVEKYPDKRIKLWSFEVKIAITHTNLRKCFFQAVANSSWANYAYLVAEDLDDNAEQELGILSNLYGVGFIQLNFEQPIKSQILIPAKERSDINWDTANKLVEASDHFCDFIREVRNFCDGGEFKKSRNRRADKKKK